MYCTYEISYDLDAYCDECQCNITNFADHAAINDTHSHHIDTARVTVSIRMWTGEPALSSELSSELPSTMSFRLRGKYAWVGMVDEFYIRTGNSSMRIAGHIRDQIVTHLQSLTGPNAWVLD